MRDDRKDQSKEALKGSGEMPKVLCLKLNWNQFCIVRPAFSIVTYLTFRHVCKCQHLNAGKRACSKQALPLIKCNIEAAGGKNVIRRFLLEAVCDSCLISEGVYYCVL